MNRSSGLPWGKYSHQCVTSTVKRRLAIACVTLSNMVSSGRWLERRHPGWLSKTVFPTRQCGFFDSLLKAYHGHHQNGTRRKSNQPVETTRKNLAAAARLTRESLS